MKININDEVVSKIASELVQGNHSNQENIKNIICSITIGSVTYDVWKSNNKKKFVVIKSVLPNQKIAERDYHKEMTKKEILKEINNIVAKSFEV
jgi:hypothetical protein